MIEQDKQAQPMEGIYFRNRPYLYEWCRNQAIKLNITKQTYANTLYLMDCYYKYIQFKQQQFMKTAICLFIISSKSLEKHVLFTPTVANTNAIPPQHLLQKQTSLIQYFDYHLTDYNYVRVVNYYLGRWDECIQCINSLSHITFLRQSLQSYLRYQQIVYLCQAYLSTQGSLPHQKIKMILAYFLHTRCHLSKQCCDELIDRTFEVMLYTQEEEREYAYAEAVEKGDYEQELSKVSKQFADGKLKQLSLRYGQWRNRYSTYSQLLFSLT